MAASWSALGSNGAGNGAINGFVSAFAVFDGLSAERFKVEVQARRAECLVFEGRHQEALEVATECRDAAANSPVGGLEALIERSIGYALHQARRPDEARPHFEESLRIARELNAQYEVALTLRALAATGAFRVSLSGGSTPKTLYTLLASDDFRGRFPWTRVSWYWGDERFVPYDHPESNYRMTRESMLSKAPVPPENIHPVPADGAPEEAALNYERTLQAAYGAAVLDRARPLFDITLLGLGTDGHTASLLPNDPVLQERKHWVAAVSHGRSFHSQKPSIRPAAR